jgi:hypothetical protein
LGIKRKENDRHLSEDFAQILFSVRQ